MAVSGGIDWSVELIAMLVLPGTTVRRPQKAAPSEKTDEPNGYPDLGSGAAHNKQCSSPSGNALARRPFVLGGWQLNQPNQTKRLGPKILRRPIRRVPQSSIPSGSRVKKVAPAPPPPLTKVRQIPLPRHQPGMQLLLR